MARSAIVDVSLTGTSAPDTASTVATHTQGLFSADPLAAPGEVAGVDVTDTSIQIPQTIVSQAASPQVLVKATGNPTVTTHKTAFA